MIKAKKSNRTIVPGFAAMIKQERERQGLSVVELAKLSGIAVSTLYSIESEERAPSLYVASKLAAALRAKAYLHEPARKIGKL